MSNISRRDFLKIIGISSLIPIIKWRLEMQSAQITDIFRRLSNNEDLSENDYNDIHFHFEEVEQLKNKVNSLFRPGTDILNIPTTFELIYSSVLELDIPSLEVEIPSAYKNLMVMGSGRTDDASNLTNMRCRFNDDSGSVYDTTGHGVSNGSNGVFQDLTQTSVIVGIFPGALATAGMSGFLFGIFPNLYSGFWKGAVSLLGSYNTSTNMSCYQDYGVWENTDPVSKISIFSTLGGNIVAGTSISVYGLR